MFTTRPELLGTFGMTASTHWTATAVGMAVLERGGNAFDAAVAMGFVLQVVEPHNCGPAGDVPMIFRAGPRGEPTVLCGQGPAPAGATIAHYRAEGLDLIPRSGPLAAVVPGATPAWLTMLRDHGTWSLDEVLAPAISYAQRGWPVAALTAVAVEGSRVLFEEDWPTSASYWLPGGRAPRQGERYRNPELAATWERLLADARGSGSREASIDRAITVWCEGFVAEELARFSAMPHGDGLGNVYPGVLTVADCAAWRPTYEPTVRYDHGGWTVHKCGPWSQGPVLLQSLAILERLGIDAVDPFGADFVHLVTEAMKLAYADRDTFYADPDRAAVPMDVLLSATYNDERAALVDLAVASSDYRPGTVAGFGLAPDYAAAVARQELARAWGQRVSGEAAGSSLGSGGAAGAAAKAAAAAGPPKGDTCHIDVADRWGNVVSATPSGGWLQSSPHIPALGFPLGSRAQMFWMDEAHPSALAPGKRPRTTLTPSLATSEGRALSFGTPGGDGQDQWQLAMFLRVVHGGMNLQEAIDAPAFHSAHWPESFWPRQAYPGRLIAESRFGDDVLEDLRARGHKLVKGAPWSEGSLSAVQVDETDDGFWFRAAANPRTMQGYAAGR